MTSWRRALTSETKLPHEQSNSPRLERNKRANFEKLNKVNMLAGNVNWIDILKHFDRKGYVWNGLTLPFLIGYKRVLQPGKTLQSISSFIKEASNMSVGITVMTCGNIREFVFGTLDSETDKMRKHYKDMYREFGNLVITDRSFSECSNLDAIINVLEHAHNTHINTGNFSKISGNWQYYSAIEQNHIKELLEV